MAATGLIFGIALAYVLLQRVFLGGTWGGKIWKIRQLKSNGSSSFFTVFIGGLVTTLSLLVSTGLVSELVLKHPYWTQATEWKMEPFVPNPKSAIIAPFFYTLGGWPRKFNKQTLLYTVPYEKGPPTRFVGRIIAELESPDIRLVIEGPKTPDPLAKTSQIKDCILNLTSLRCVNLRETVLSRHLKEVNSFAPKHWTLQWFHIANPMLPPESQPQGIYLRATGLNWIQDRFILISNSGIHQSLILNRTRNAVGDQAFTMTQEIVRSLRVFDELNSGRAWANRSLEIIQLDDVKNIQDSQIQMSSLAEIQGLLISKISVDPSNFDSYFHLAGTSMMIAGKAENSRDRLFVNSNKNIQSVSLFAEDIAPYDPRTTQIKNMLNELKNR
jgi:hypothetical protein